MIALSAVPNRFPTANVPMCQLASPAWKEEMSAARQLETREHANARDARNFKLQTPNFREASNFKLQALNFELLNLEL